MKTTEKENLKAAGWEVGGVEDFLGLTKEELALVKIRVALARGVKSRRAKKRLTQTTLAKLLKSSQSRVAKMEAADSSVSIDLLLRSLLTLGVTQKDLGKILSNESA